MKREYVLTVHSFVDLITNSSTEIYVEATEKTIESVKDIINNLLGFASSNHTADDLFEFTLVDEDKENYGEDYERDNGYRNVRMEVSPKIKDSVELETASKILSKLDSLFHIGGEYNG
jgi:hypothetical protein